MLKISFAFVSRASGSDGLIACRRWKAAKTIGANADFWWSRGCRSATHHPWTTKSYMNMNHGWMSLGPPWSSFSVPKYCAIQSVGGSVVQSDMTVRSVMNVAGVASLLLASPPMFINKLTYTNDSQKARTSSLIDSAGPLARAEWFVDKRVNASCNGW